MGLKEIKDGDILKEFRQRFDGSVLYSWQISSLLTIIGIEHIKIFLKEIGFRVVKINSPKVTTLKLKN